MNLLYRNTRSSPARSTKRASSSSNWLTWSKRMAGTTSGTQRARNRAEPPLVPPLHPPHRRPPWLVKWGSACVSTKDACGTRTSFPLSALNVKLSVCIRVLCLFDVFKEWSRITLQLRLLKVGQVIPLVSVVSFCVRLLN